MARKQIHQATGAMELSVPLFGVVTALWLFSIVSLSFVTVDPPFAGPKQWLLDGSAHMAVFLALTLVPGLFVRSTRLLVVAILLILGLAAGLEGAQAAQNQTDLKRGDVFANFLGFAAGMLLVVPVRWKIRRLRSGAGRVARGLRRRYGFTTEEARLASHLALGGSLAAYAELIELSVEEVRDTAERVYEKTRTQGQAELMRLLLDPASTTNKRRRVPEPRRLAAN